MIGTSLWDYVFIRLCIVFLHYVAPLSALYCVAILIIRSSSFRIPVVFEIWAVAETLYLLLIYFPRRYVLQHAAAHPEVLPRDKRRRLFELCHDTVADPEEYLSKWFKGAPSSEIKRDNVKEFFCWAFLNKGAYGMLDDEELEEYTDKMESRLGRQFEPGRGNAKSLRLTMDRVNMLHRSLLWYLCVFVVDTITYVCMLWHSFHFYRLTLKRFFTVFPFRPLTLITTYRSPAKTLTYWHRPHTSKTRLPVLFIHGIGIGLYPYVNFLAQLNHKNDENTDEGDVGIIAIEIMPVSFRITHAALEKDELCREILGILKKHGWGKVVLVSHSYGSVISTHLLHNEETRPFVGPLFLIDPVVFLLHLPEVAYNFTCRKPTRANEYQLHYFASMDMGVAHTLGRRFFWSENILWKPDIEDRRTTVVLSGKDLIVDTETVGRYLAANNNGMVPENWKDCKQKGTGLDVLWFDDLDHAQVFDSKANCETLVKVVRGYSLEIGS